MNGESTTIKQHSGIPSIDGGEVQGTVEGCENEWEAGVLKNEERKKEGKIARGRANWMMDG